MNSEDTFVQIPQSILEKLKSIGDTKVLYSKFGKLDIDYLKFECICVENCTEFELRTNLELLNRTTQGEKLSRGFREYPDSESDNFTKEYYDLKLAIVTLPSELVNSQYIKFIPESYDRAETIHFNILKIKFNKDGTFLIF